MNIIDAILKAADHIEAHPEDFEFGETQVPNACGTPGCALGWIGHFLGGMEGETYMMVSRLLGYTFAAGFYGRLSETEGTFWPSGKWPSDAKACATALRKYADKYHGEAAA